MLKTFGSTFLVFVFAASAFGGQLSRFEEKVEESGKKSSGNSYYSDCDDDDSSFGEEILSGIFKGCVTTFVEDVFTGAYLGTKWLVYDWWADDDGEEGYIEPDPATPVTPIPSDSVDVSTNRTVVLDKLSDEKHVVYTDDPGSIDDPEDIFADALEPPLLPGTVGMPYARFDYHWQYLDPHTAASTYTLETGYRHAAFSGRMSRYRDDEDNETLDINQYYALGRTGRSSDIGSVQIGMGIGGYVINGEKHKAGAAFTVPISYCYKDIVGIEFRPAFADINGATVRDYDVSISLGYQYVQLRAGYRWLWVDSGSWLDGYHAGFSIMY